MSDLPLWILVEDGTEYWDRFTRFLSDAATFASAHSAAECIALLPGATGLVLDLDFRRTPHEALVDESGATSATRGVGEQRRLAESQGILILQKVRTAGATLPAILCADLDDAEQRAYLESTLAPLVIAGSRATLAELGEMLRAASAKSEIPDQD